jgi:hypothetical protein
VQLFTCVCTHNHDTAPAEPQLNHGGAQNGRQFHSHTRDEESTSVSENEDRPTKKRKKGGKKKGKERVH